MFQIAIVSMVQAEPLASPSDLARLLQPLLHVPNQPVRLLPMLPQAIFYPQPHPPRAARNQQI